MAVNMDPVVTTSGGSTSFTEGNNVTSTPVVIDSALVVSDADNPTLASATVAITGNYQSGQDILAFANLDPAIYGNITASYDAALGILTLTSAGATATLAEWQAALQAVTYTNLSEVPNTATRTMSYVVNDGTADSMAATRSVSVQSTNDAPVNSVPGDQTLKQDSSLVFSSANGNQISISDADAGSAMMQVTLSVTLGTITLPTLSGLIFSVGSGTSDSTMTINGSIADINSALQGMIYVPTPGYNGADSLQLTTGDLGNSGSGGSRTDSDSISLSIAPPNPLVTHVSSSNPDGAYKVGDTISVTVNFDSAVTVDTSGGTPTLLLETGATDRIATYVSGSGSSTLTFLYVVQSGDLSADLDFQSISALALNGAAIRDASNLDAFLTLPTIGGANSFAGQKDIVIDGVAPVTSSVSVPADGNYFVGQNLDFTVNFSEAVVVDTASGTPRIAIQLNQGGTAYATYMSGSGTSAVVFRMTVATGQKDFDGISLGADLQTNGGTIQDQAGNIAATTLNGVASTAHVDVGPNRILGTDEADRLRGTADDDIIRGRGDDDRLFGLAGDDVLRGGWGDDRMTGGDGADMFVFRGGRGRDVITDFDYIDFDANGAIMDKIDLRNAPGIRNFADLEAHHLSMNADGGSTLITTEDGAVLVLRGVDMADLGEIHFLF